MTSASSGAKRPLQPPARRAGRVTLWAPEAGISLVVRHAELPQIENERAGTWEEVPRAGRTPITVWPGYEGLRERLELHLDGWQEFPARSVHDDLAKIRALWTKVDGLDRPPWLRAIGVVPYPGTRWVITKPSSIEEQQHAHGQCVRARVELTLLEWVAPDVALRVERSRNIARRRTHAWARGDTLAKLAKRYLGDARRAPDIRAANPRIRSWSRVAPGTEIVIPY